MNRVAIALLTLLAASSAHAAPLGLDPADLPEAPASRRPDLKFKERRAAVLRGDLPERLVPYTYLRNGRLTSSRYYTEEGEVLRMREVLLVLEASEHSTAEMDTFRKHRSAAQGWAYASLALLPLMPLNLIPLAGAMPHNLQAERAFERALHDHNEASWTRVDLARR